MNEDTFTVQLMDMSERVHSLDKKTLKSFRHENRSLMPAYDASRLPNADLDDLVAYLQIAALDRTGAEEGRLTMTDASRTAVAARALPRGGVARRRRSRRSGSPTPRASRSSG